MFRILALLFACVAFLQTPTHAAQPETISLSTHDLCPYGCYTDSGEFDGHAVRVVRHALKQMGVGLELVVVPWERAQFMARNGDVDGFFAASRNPRRDSEGEMSAIIAEQKWNWYLLVTSPFDPNSPDFKEKAKVTSFIGANMLKWLRKNGYKVSPPPPTTEDLASMLLFRRFDAALANNLVMEEIIRRRNLDTAFKVFTLKDKPLGVYFTNDFVQKNPGFLEKFNKHVREYRQRNR